MAIELHPAYVAGILDGEGTIHILPRGGYSLVVSVAGKYKPTLDALKEQYGGFVGVIRQPTLGSATCYQYRIQHQRAADLLKDVLPYLREKRARADIALRFQETMGQRLGRGVLVPEEIMMLRGRLHLELKALNKKGVSYVD